MTSSSDRHALTAPSSSPALATCRTGATSGVVARGRGTLASITDLETNLLTLTPEFLADLCY